MSYPVYISLTADSDDMLRILNLSALLIPAFIELLLLILCLQETVAGFVYFGGELLKLLFSFV